MASGDLVVEGVDALKDGDLILAQLQGRAPAVVAHLADELILGDHDLLPVGQGGKVAGEQLHVQALGGFIVDVPLGGAGRGAGVDGGKVVIHRHGVGVDSPPLQLLRDLHGSGGLARTGRAGEQHNGTALDVGQDLIRRQRDPLAVILVALG